MTRQEKLEQLLNDTLPNCVTPQKCDEFCVAFCYLNSKGARKQLVYVLGKSMHTHTQTHTNTNAHIHTHTHTYSHTDAHTHTISSSHPSGPWGVMCMVCAHRRHTQQAVCRHGGPLAGLPAQGVLWYGAHQEAGKH
ncbi:hypothetical protein EON63_22755 [archaeon]|nr:MAG: hypothetical protein EON63_22755 [archaeon]